MQVSRRGIFDTAINNIALTFIIRESFVSKNENKSLHNGKVENKATETEITDNGKKLLYVLRQVQKITTSSIYFRAKQFPKAHTHSSLKRNEHENFTIGTDSVHMSETIVFLYSAGVEKTIYKTPVFSPQIGTKPRIRNENTYCFQT